MSSIFLLQGANVIREKIAFVWRVEEDTFGVPSGPISTTVFIDERRPCFLCGTYGACSSSGITVTSQRYDMSPLWVPRGYVAHVSAVLEVILIGCGAMPHLVTVRKLRTAMIIFDARPRHSCEGDRNRNAYCTARGPTFRLYGRLLQLYPYEPHRRSTGAGLPTT